MNKTTDTRIPVIRIGDQTWARSNKERANTSEEYLDEIFKPNQLSQNEAFQIEVTKHWNNPYK
jgi:hypothetical protein